MRNVPDESDQQARFQAFLNDVDPALLESLKRDERHRRRKLIFIAIAGGLIMGSIIATMAFMLLAHPAGQVSAKQADQALATMSEGWQLWQSEKFDQAADKFRQSIALDPTNAEAFNGLGWSLLNGGDQKSAEEAFTKCLSIRKDHPAALNGLGAIAYSRSDMATAEKDWLTAAPNAPAAQVGLAKLYLLQGKYDQAKKYAEAAAAAPGADANVQQLLAAAQAGRLDPELKKMIEPRAGGGAGESARGWALFQQGEFNQAKEAFESALAKNPNDASALNGLGFVLVNLGKPEQAAGYFEKCLKIEPDTLGAINGLAICRKSEGKVDEAVKLWESIVNKPPVPNAATSGLAMTYFERKEYAKAAPLLEELDKAEPGNPQIRQMLETARSTAK